MYQRPTALAAALINATAKQINAGTVDHVRGTGNWVARRIAISAETRPSLGIVTDFDHSPRRPAPASIVAAKKSNVLDKSTINAINEGILEVAEISMAAKSAHLEDGEVFGLD